MKTKVNQFFVACWLLLPLLLGASITPSQAETGFLGLEVQGFNENTRQAFGNNNPAGVLVKNIALGEAGARAGFRRGDLIIEFNGSKIKDFNALVKAVVKTKVGQEAVVMVLRNGHEHKLKLDLGKRPAAWKISTGSFANYPDIGITVAAITKQVRQRFALRWDSLGVVVTLVDTESEVVAGGLKPGDVIVQANLREIWQPGQLTKIIAAAKKNNRSAILILIESPSGFRYSLLPIKKK